MNKTMLFGSMLSAVTLGFTGTPALAMPDTRVRAEIPAKYRWDFTAIYPSWEAWEAGVKEMEAKMDAFSAMKGSLASGPAAVLKAYKAYDDIGILQYKVYRYPQLQRDTIPVTRTSPENSSASARSSRSSRRRPRGSRRSC
jgi:oligoendopeptidase F